MISHISKRRFRNRLVKYLFFAILLAAVVAGPRLIAVWAATPSSAAISPAAPSTSWTGQSYLLAATPVPTACPAAADPLNALCDHFQLNVTVDPSYWTTNTGGVLISIEWPSSANDFDLFVFDSTGAQVGSSASGGTTMERVFLPKPSGVYEVRVVPFLVTNSGYTGNAQFSAAVAGPSRDTGGLLFAPAVVIDAQRTEGEPINHIDKFGHYWESGPWGFSTAQSFVHKSVDSGNQFNIVSVAGLRPDSPPGGGDSDIITDDQGFAYFVDLEGPLTNLGTSVSNDGGNNWRKNLISVPTTLTDRQWFAVDNGLTGGTADNTVFLTFNQQLGSFIFSTPGSTGPLDPTGGIVWQNASADIVNPVSDLPRCGQLRFDPVHRNLYLPCSADDRVDVVIGHVNPGQRTGIEFHRVQLPASPGGGGVDELFPLVAVDRAGNVYGVWVDGTNHNLYYSASTDQGQNWSAPVRINGNEANSNVFPWAQAGVNGTLVVAWLGNESLVDSDNMPSWFANRPASNAFPWFGYVAIVTNATSASPSFVQQRFTEKPMHYGQICTGGIGCTISDGDRSMADYMAHYLDRDGSIRVVYNDTTSQHHGAHLFEARQIAGPTGFGTTINRPAPANPMADPVGDAQSPHYAPTGAGSNLPQLDFTEVRLTQPDVNTLRVQMTLKNLTSLSPPTGKLAAVWLTRFQALSRGDQTEDAYRIFYVGAESVGGGAPKFFAGSGNSAQDAIPGNGCINTSPENCKVVQYPAEVTAIGSMSGNSITIDVPLQGGFGAGRPILGNVLFNVTALSAGRNNDLDIFADADATLAFDFTLGQVTPPGTGRAVTGGGAIPAGNADAEFSLEVSDRLKGKLRYRDATGGIDFTSTRITSVTFNDAAHTAKITGAGVTGGQEVEFTVIVTDNGEPGTTDRFDISLSNGYQRNGTLKRGNIKIH